MVKITWGLTPGPSPATVWHAAFLLLALPGHCMLCSVPQVASCASSFLLSPFTKDPYQGSVSPSADNSDFFSCQLVAPTQSLCCLLILASSIRSAFSLPSHPSFLSVSSPSLCSTQLKPNTEFSSKSLDPHVLCDSLVPFKTPPKFSVPVSSGSKLQLSYRLLEG